MNGRSCGFVTLTLAGVLATAGFARAEMMMAELVPLGRLEAGIQARLERNPQDGKAHYDLARLHYVAFANRALLVEAWSSDELAPDWLRMDFVHQARQHEAQRRAAEEFDVEHPWDLPQAEQQEFWGRRSKIQQELATSGWEPPRLTEEELQQHAATALTAFDMAIRLEPTQALYVHGRASLCKQVREFLDSRILTAPSEAFRERVGTQALLEAFWSAFELARESDLDQEYQPLEGLPSLVSYEAGRAYLGLLDAHGPEASAEQGGRREQIAHQLDGLQELPIGAITPLVVCLQADRELAELVDDEARVRFDLRGLGAEETWPWLRPEAGFVVWDPRGTGVVRSGRQLFGCTTWRLLARHGYASLARLDMDGDAALTGAELEGLAVWFDRDANGISNPGEVTPIGDLGVAALRTEPTGRVGRSWRCDRGLELEDGRELPTWDWVTEPLPDGRP